MGKDGTQLILRARVVAIGKNVESTSGTAVGSSSCEGPVVREGGREGGREWVRIWLCVCVCRIRFRFPLG